VLLFEKDRVSIPSEYFERTARGEETPVKMGETIGSAV